MNDCTEILAATGPADMLLPLLAAVALIGAGVTVVLWRRRRTVGVAGALMLVLALAAVPLVSPTPANATSCPVPVAEAPVTVDPPVDTPADPPACVPSVTLEPSSAPAWVRVGFDGVVWTVTVEPDQGFADAAAAVGATVTVAGSWTVGGYMYGYTAEGEYVDGGGFPWTASTSGDLPLTIDTTGPVAEAGALFLAANPTVDPSTVGPFTNVSSGEVTVTATYSDGCNPATVLFPVTPGGGGGNN